MWKEVCIGRSLTESARLEIALRSYPLLSHRAPDGPPEEWGKEMRRGPTGRKEKNPQYFWGAIRGPGEVRRKREEMVRVELTEQEGELLREVLVSYVSGLRMEIAYSQRKEFRDFLKKRGDWLEELLRSLEKN